MTQACLACNTEVKRNDKHVKCVMCKLKYHLRCSNLNSDAFTIINANANVNFTCNYCSKIDINSEIQELKVALSECMAEIRKQSDMISKITNDKGCNQDKLLYSEVAHRNEEILILKPVNEKQTNSVTRKDLVSNIDPSKLAVGVENVRNISKGAVLIKCADTHSRNTIKSKVEEVLNDKYQIENGVKRNPRVIIVGVEEDIINLEEENMKRALLEQNDLRNMANDIKIIAKFMTKNKKSGSIIIETEPTHFNTLLKMDKINLGWRKCKLYEYFNVRRCFKCLAYGHKAAECTQDVSCSKCAGNHNSNECNTESVMCINCVRASKKYKIKIDTEHNAFDKNCTCYKRAIEQATNKTNYAI